MQIYRKKTPNFRKTKIRFVYILHFKQKYAALRLLQKYLKILGYICFIAIALSIVDL